MPELYSSSIGTMRGLDTARQQNPWETPAAQSFTHDMPLWDMGVDESHNPWETPGVSAAPWYLEGQGGSIAVHPSTEVFSQMPNVVRPSESVERQNKLRGFVGKIGNRVLEAVNHVRMRFGSARETFGAGGHLSQGIDAARHFVGQVENVRGGRAFRMAEKVPGLGKYAKTAGAIIDAAGAVSAATRGIDYDGFAAGMDSAWADRGEARDQLRGAVVDMAKGAGKAGAREVAGRYGVELNEQGRLERVRIAKLGRSVVRTVFNPTRLVGDARAGVHAAARHTSQEARMRATDAAGAIVGGAWS